VNEREAGQVKKSADSSKHLFKSKAIAKLAILVVVGTVSVLVALAVLGGQQPGADDYQSLMPRGDVILGIEVASVSDAESLVGRSLVAPQHAPSGLQLRTIRANAETRTVYMVFAGPSLGVPKELTWSWLRENGCWVFIQSPQDPAVAPEKLIDDIVSQSEGRASRISISGSPGLIYCPGDLDSAVHWWSGGIHYALVTPRETGYSELLGFAEAIAAQV